MQKIILASQSPRRKQLLEWAEVPFEVVVQPTEETYPDQLSMEEIPIYIARQKAAAVKNFLFKNDGDELLPVLAADTVVVFENMVIGKPKNRADAIDTLQKLSGHSHNVVTGVVIEYGEQDIAFSETTHVTFHPLTLNQIEFYVDTYKPYDKAGAYAIQEWIGVVGIKSVNGDFYNVMGLPVSRVVMALHHLTAWSA